MKKSLRYNKTYLGYWVSKLSLKVAMLCRIVSFDNCSMLIESLTNTRSKIDVNDRIQVFKSVSWYFLALSFLTYSLGDIESKCSILKPTRISKNFAWNLIEWYCLFHIFLICKNTLECIFSLPHGRTYWTFFKSSNCRSREGKKMGIISDKSNFHKSSVIISLLLECYYWNSINNKKCFYCHRYFGFCVLKIVVRQQKYIT